MKSWILGTAQWGLDYGITNSSGRLADSVLGDLVDAAVDRGICRLDTAASYGDAELRVGAVGRDFEVQTKIAAAGLDLRGVTSAVRSSLRRLDRSSVAGCLVHDWPSLSNRDRATGLAGLAAALESGMICQWGVSAYSEVDLVEFASVATMMDLPLDRTVVQVPGSVLDQRLAGGSGFAVIESLRGNGVEIQLRSVFLQGVTVDRSSANPFSAHADVVRLFALADALGVSALDLSIGWAVSQSWVDAVAIGPTSRGELLDILAAAECEATRPAYVAWDSLASTDSDLIDPRRWAVGR